MVYNLCFKSSHLCCTACLISQTLCYFFVPDGQTYRVDKGILAIVSAIDQQACHGMKWNASAEASTTIKCRPWLAGSDFEFGPPAKLALCQVGGCARLSSKK